MARWRSGHAEDCKSYPRARLTRRIWPLSGQLRAGTTGTERGRERTAPARESAHYVPVAFLAAAFLALAATACEAATCGPWSCDSYRDRQTRELLNQVNVEGRVAALGESTTAYIAGFAGIGGGAIPMANFGVPGQTVPDLVKLIDAVVAMKPRALHVWTGLNTAAAIAQSAPTLSPQKRAAALASVYFAPMIDILTAVAAAGTPVAVMALPPGGSPAQAQHNAWANTYLRQIVRRAGNIAFIDTDVLVGAGGLIDPRYGIPNSSHLTAAGYRALEARQLPWLESVMGPAEPRALIQFRAALARGEADEALRAVALDNWPVSVPEPWGAALFALGLAWVAGRKR